MVVRSGCSLLLYSEGTFCLIKLPKLDLVFAEYYWMNREITQKSFSSQWNAGTHHDKDAIPGQSTRRTGSGAAPPPFTSFPFDPSTFPANFENVFMNVHPCEPNNHSANPTPCFAFDPSVLPANLTNMFMNLAPNPSSHGEHAQSAPERDDNNPGFDGHGIRIGNNVNLSMGGSMPEEISGALRSVLQMFAGSASHGSSEPTSEGTAPR